MWRNAVWGGLCLLLMVSMAQAQNDDLDAAIEAALRPRPDAPIYYQAAGRDIAGDAGIVYLSLWDAAADEQYEGVIDIMPAVRRSNGWDVRLPGDFGYGALFTELPPGIIRNLDTTPYKPLADPVLAPRQPYRFPWADGQWATVTRSYRVHGRGTIDFDLSGLDVTAAKDGTIIYVNDRSDRNTYDSGAWWYWNVVIIEHSPHEYSLYGHLLHDSVPDAIKAQCTDDYSAANCAVPVRAGEVIGQEGNTGYSTNPHLHIEFGQAYGIVPYLTREAGFVYAGYVYKEQNVQFEGYSATQVAGWQWGQLHQASHGPRVPPGVNIVRNGDFSAGAAEWSASGQVNWAMQEGVMRFLRLRTSDPPDWARFYQDLHYGVPANTPFEVTLDLGNDSGIRKTVTVSLVNTAGRHYGILTCDFVIEPGTPLRGHVLRGKTGSTWANVRLEIGVNPPDSAPAALVDNISVHHLIDLSVRDTVCD